MREIEFRGVSIESHNFVYGLPKIIENKRGEIVSYFICSFNSSFNLTETEVFADSIAQYTGRLDDAEVKIYDGDLLCNYNGQLSTIYFKNGTFFLHFEIFGEDDTYDFPFCMIGKIGKVIGDKFRDVGWMEKQI